jgi:hypothetical protein
MNKRDWFKQAKFGMTIHRGVYALPAGDRRMEGAAHGGHWRMVAGLLMNGTQDAPERLMMGKSSICAAPYHADPAGRQDSTEAILRALDDITHITRLAFRQGISEVESLPAQGVHYHPGGVENHLDNGIPGSRKRCSLTGAMVQWNSQTWPATRGVKRC